MYDKESIVKTMLSSNGGTSGSKVLIIPAKWILSNKVRLNRQEDGAVLVEFLKEQDKEEYKEKDKEQEV